MCVPRENAQMHCFFGGRSWIWGMGPWEFGCEWASSKAAVGCSLQNSVSEKSNSVSEKSNSTSEKSGCSSCPQSGQIPHREGHFCRVRNYKSGPISDLGYAGIGCPPVKLDTLDVVLGHAIPLGPWFGVQGLGFCLASMLPGASTETFHPLNPRPNPSNSAKSQTLNLRKRALPRPRSHLKPQKSCFTWL